MSSIVEEDFSVGRLTPNLFYSPINAFPQKTELLFAAGQPVEELCDNSFDFNGRAFKKEALSYWETGAMLKIKNKTKKWTFTKKKLRRSYWISGEVCVESNWIRVPIGGYVNTEITDNFVIARKKNCFRSK